MGKQTFNWAAAFVAYVNNHPFQEIAESFGIPLEKLQDHATRERWESLRTELPLGTCEPLAAVPGLTVGLVGPSDPFAQGKGLSIPTELPLAIQKKLQGLMANRQLNYTQGDNLRTYLNTIISKLLDGTLKMEQVFHNKGQIVRTTREISPADLVNIATFARTVHDMTYKALGDTTAQTERGQDAPPGQTQVPQIIISLPSAIAQPRQQAKLLTEAKKAGIEIIDVPGVVATELPEPPEPTEI